MPISSVPQRKIFLTLMPGKAFLVPMTAVRLKAVCLASIWVFGFTQARGAVEANTACQASLEEDKPPCVLETRFVLEAGGSNVLKATLAFIGESFTNANHEISNSIELPPEVMSQLRGPSVFMAPPGMSIVLPHGTPMDGLGPAILTSLQRSHLPNGAANAVFPRLPPKVYTKAPPQGIVTEPGIEIKGMVDQPLFCVSYDVLNDSRPLANLPGYITDEFFDNQQMRFTTNWFECVDVDLAPGTNVVTIHCDYPGGGRSTIKKVYVLRLDLKTNAPKFQITWPVPGRPVSGEEAAIRGFVDDISARVTGEITDGAPGMSIEGVVERTGRFWVEHVPLASKTNHLKITMTDVVGHSSVTNLTLVKSGDRIVINPVPPNQLWQMEVTVAGSITPPGRAVWVNGRKADVQSNGEWKARGVPLSKNDGVAVFDVVAIPPSEPPLAIAAQQVETNSEIKPVESVSIRTGYTPGENILNASQPTYGPFKIHLSGTGGQSFVLQDSTNLVDWVPILTNLNSAATFDYYDTNVLVYGSRFFRVVPIR